MSRYPNRARENMLLDTLHKQRTEWEEAARGNLERHLGDVADESPDSIYDEAYTLAFDGAHDAGAPDDIAKSIAQEIAQSYAQP